jgi:uncharacterized protein (TIGR02996 family)
MIGRRANMNTEEALQAAIDADPGDATARLVFADYLDEQNDPRGPGYRWLGQWYRVPERTTCLVGEVRLPAWMFCCGDNDPWSDYYWRRKGRSRIPRDLSDLIDNRHVNVSRADLENILAECFAQLSPKRQAELLSPILIQA